MIAEYVLILHLRAGWNFIKVVICLLGKKNAWFWLLQALNHKTPPLAALNDGANLLLKQALTPGFLSKNSAE